MTSRETIHSNLEEELKKLERTLRMGDSEPVRKRVEVLRKRIERLEGCA